jgi:predicted CopG family antitoxin
LDYKEIRKLAIQALFLDDDLSDILVLKGGNALSILELTRRGSYDLDFSLYECTLEDEELEEKFRNAISDFFEENDYKIINFKFTKKPKKEIAPQTFKWGGYAIEFKFLPLDKYEHITNTIQKATVKKAYAQEYQNMTGTSQPVLIELSKNEYCKGFSEKPFEDITLKIYSPCMIIFEKLRAICQQMDEYTKRSTKASRARDFFDIYTVNKAYQIEHRAAKDTQELKELCNNIFEIKEVDIDLLEKLDNYKTFHEQSFQKVIDSVLEDERKDLESFDFYFEETKKVAKWVLINFR